MLLYSSIKLVRKLNIFQKMLFRDAKKDSQCFIKLYADIQYLKFWLMIKCINIWVYKWQFMTKNYCLSWHDPPSRMHNSRHKNINFNALLIIQKHVFLEQEIPTKNCLRNSAKKLTAKFTFKKIKSISKPPIFTVY